MKNKGQIWYIGYIVSLFLIVTILVTDFPKMVDIGLAILFSAVFGVSHVQILHDKMIKNDADYKINVMDERNIIIKEKAGNITNMFNTILLGVATVIFICLNFTIPANIVGRISSHQQVISIIISCVLEEKM